MKKLLLFWLLISVQVTVPALVRIESNVVHAQATLRTTMQGFTPSLVLDFTQGSMPAGLTFTRNSIATRYNASGILETVAANVPRLDYDPVTLQPRGLLIEEPRTNTVLNSELGGAVVGVVGSGGSWPTGWVGPNTSFTTTIQSSRTDSKGRKLIKVNIAYSNSTGSAVYPRIKFSSPAATPGQTWTSTLYIESNVCNLDARTFIEEQNASVYSATTSTMLSSGTQTQTRTLSGSGTTNAIFQLGVNVNPGQTLDWTFEIGMPQFEQGAFATSYIPTAGSTVTRQADLCLINSLPSWFNPLQGTWIAETVLGQRLTARIIGYDGSGNFLGIGSGQQSVTESWNGSAGFNKAGLISTGVVRHGMSYSPTGRVLTREGLTPATNNQSNGTITQIALGANTSGANPLGAWIRKAVYYPRQVSNSLLQSLTQ